MSAELKLSLKLGVLSLADIRIICRASLKPRLLSSISIISESVGLGRNLRVWISNPLPGDADLLKHLHLCSRKNPKWFNYCPKTFLMPLIQSQCYSTALEEERERKGREGKGREAEGDINVCQTAMVDSSVCTSHNINRWFCSAYSVRAPGSVLHKHYFI